RPASRLPRGPGLETPVGAALAPQRGSRRERRSYNAGMDEAIERELSAGLAALGLDAALGGPLLAYLALLAKWNRTYNLTAVREPRDMVAKHLLDSLAMHGSVAGIAARGGSLADLGTGPGLPGIPLAIAYPRL